MEYVTTDEQWQALRSGKTRLVVDFFASWCGPCRQLAPIFETVANAKQSDTVRFCKVDIDQLQSVGAELNITALPTLLILDEQGSEVARHVGLLDDEELKNWIDRFIG